MQSTILLLSASMVLELVLHMIPAGWLYVRRIMAVLVIMSIVGSLLATFILAPLVVSALLGILYGYRLFNMARIISARMHQQYLWRVTYATTLRLFGLQLLVIVGLIGFAESGVAGRQVIVALVIIQIFIAVIMHVTINGHERRMRYAANTSNIKDTQLPSLTVAIPARNETEDLQACLKSLLASHYPKLEILVLDDCSQERRTSDIIRSFAHDGVRFIRGREPQDSWLAKNQAYDELARQASGEYIFFCGVDVRFEPGSLRQAVSYAVDNHKSMVCLLPINQLPASSVPLIQPMRYLWELALPRKLFNKPPVLSTAWLVRRDALSNAGGFEAARRMVVPEAYFATRLLEDNRYSFVASGTALGITSLKSTSAQRDTAVRVSYPSLHRRPQTVAAVGLLYAAWNSLPMVLTVFVLNGTMSPAYSVIAAAPVIISAAIYAKLLRLAYGTVRIQDIAAFPVAAAIYIALINYSMYKYEFSEVVWKGRNVCIPVMHVVSSLPKI